MASLSALFDALWATAFSLWGSPVTWAEIAAFVLSLWMVERNVRVSVWAWPLAIAASGLSLALFARSGLYGESALQALFIAVSLWGWWQWRGGHQGVEAGRPMTRLTVKHAWAVAACTLIAWPLVGWLLQRHTDSTVPFFDALLTTASVAGQWLLARKHPENWLVWLAVNLASIALFAGKGLGLMALLYAVFAVLSWVGWRAWTRPVGRAQ